MEDLRMWRVGWLVLLTWVAWVAPVAGQFVADSKISVTSTIVANNTTAVVISAKPATVYQIDAYNNSTTLAYIKLYDACGTAASATCVAVATCGQAAGSPPTIAAPGPKDRMMIPFGTSSSGGGFALPNINGDSYTYGIVQCVTGAITDTDTTAPAAGTYIVNVHFKPQAGP